MIASGVKARIVCVDPKKMPGQFAGRDLDEAFLHEPPTGIDPSAKTATAIAASTTGQCFAKQYLSKAAKWSSARVLSLRTYDS